MFELRPEHLRKPAWEVSEVSRKYMSLYEPYVTNAPLEGGGQCERRESRGPHQWCCDTTGSGMEWNVPPFYKITGPRTVHLKWVNFAV